MYTSFSHPTSHLYSGCSLPRSSGGWSAFSLVHATFPTTSPPLFHVCGTALETSCLEKYKYIITAAKPGLWTAIRNTYNIHPQGYMRRGMVQGHLFFGMTASICRQEFSTPSLLLRISLLFLTAFWHVSLIPQVWMNFHGPMFPRRGMLDIISQNVSMAAFLNAYPVSGAEWWIFCLFSDLIFFPHTVLSGD